ncbi:MAG: hypothetical protein KDB21_17525 [Acidimicrobiales bacterium]|nr:hypothetical protein [Acidimicrobiales bacterium]
MNNMRWQRELEEITERLADVASGVAGDLEAATEALLAGDVEAALTISHRSRVVDRRTDSVEEAAQRLILLHQPMGPDFRRLMALLRVATSIDRAERLASHVAELAGTIVAESLPEPVVDSIRSVAADAATLYATAAQAFRTGDAETAARADRQDDHVDAGCRELRATVVDSFTDCAGRAETLMDLGLLCRYLERIGDHAVSLANDTVYVVTGEAPSA